MVHNSFRFGAVGFETESKTGILGKIKVQVSGGVKEYRETNEAVGVSGTMTVPTGKQGTLEAWYGGASSSGSVYWSRYDGYSGKTTYFYTPVDVRVHKDVLVVNFKPITY